MRSNRGRLRLGMFLAIAVASWLVAAAPALAAPVWNLASLSNTTVAPGGQLNYVVHLRNVGDADMDGTPFTLRGTLPDGITVASAQVIDLSRGAVIRCFDGADGTSTVVGASSFVCTDSAPLPPQNRVDNWYQKLQLRVNVDAGASGTLVTEFEISGGGGAPASTVDPVTVTPDPPPFGLEAFDGEVTADAAGTPFTQAGGHPYEATVAMDFNTITGSEPSQGDNWPVETPRNILVDLPPGLVGNPQAAAQCTPQQLAGPPGGGLGGSTFCPPDSQVGVTYIRLNPTILQPAQRGPYPVYNLVPPPGVPARFGFNILGVIITLDGELRSGGDYGLSVNARNIPEALGISGTTFTFWGVPASSAHDQWRACAGQAPPYAAGPSCRSGAPLRPFLRNPTECTPAGVGLPVTAHVDSWQNPGVFKDATWFTHLPEGYPFPPVRWGPQTGPTGCDRVPFDPTFDAQPAPGSKAGTPAAFTFDLNSPQTEDPDTIGQADLKKAVVTLPLGVRVSPSSASGLGACAPAQIGLDDGNPPTCPESSKIGSVTIDTPLLADPLEGAVYLAKPRDNPFGSLLSIYLVAEGPGVVVKLPGKVDANAISGQLTATFDDNPQLPFTNLHLAFKSGPRAPLVLPKACGTYTTTAEMTSWSGKTVVSNSSFTVNDGCGVQFSPDLQAGTENPVAGASSTFNLRLSRDDEDQEIGGLSLDLPQGLTGRIASVPLCPEAAAVSSSCPESSRVGSVTVGAGAGTNPFYISNGRVYLTGPYKGAPFGLEVVVPAVAGPFDLGLVTVRQALFVDKHTAAVRVVSDPLPTILEGIPLDVRDIRVSVDRDGFFLNPTSCEEKTINGSVQSTAGSTANVATRFQVGDCASLSLAPKMVLAVGKRGRTGRNTSTPLTATLTQTPGQTNLKSVRVVLPATINARLTVVNRACTQAEFDAGNCEKARTGTAVAVTPLLRDPLKGNAYFVKDPAKPRGALPNIIVALKGQVDFDLVGRISIPNDKYLATTFDAVPDVPITSFKLSFVAGSRGPVGTTTNLCSRRGRNAKARLEFIAQNGRERDVNQRLKIVGCKKARARRGRRR